VPFSYLQGEEETGREEGFAAGGIGGSVVNVLKHANQIEVKISSSATEPMFRPQNRKEKGGKRKLSDHT